MVREVKDPGIELPQRDPKPLPRGLARLDARAKASRVTPGVKKMIACYVGSAEKRELEAWAGESGKTLAVIIRELVRAALQCRERGRSPLSILYDAAPRGKQ